MDRAWQSTFHKGCKELNETEHTFNFGFPGSSAVKNPPAMQEMQAGDWFDPWVRKIPWRKKMATYSSILAWKIPIHGVTRESDMTGQLNNKQHSS